MQKLVSAQKDTPGTRICILRLQLILRNADVMIDCIKVTAEGDKLPKAYEAFDCK